MAFARREMGQIIQLGVKIKKLRLFAMNKVQIKLICNEFSYTTCSRICCSIDYCVGNI